MTLGEEEKAIHIHFVILFTHFVIFLHSRLVYHQSRVRLLYMEASLLIDLLMPKETARMSLMYIWIV